MRTTGRSLFQNYGRSIIMIGFVNISKAANELGDLVNFLGKNLDRLQIYILGRRDWGWLKSLATSCG